MKPIDIKDNTYIDSVKESNDKDFKFQIGDYIRISKYKNIFAKGYTPNCSEEVVMNQVILFHEHMYLMISMVKKLLEHFMKKNCKKQTKNNLE